MQWGTGRPAAFLRGEIVGCVGVLCKDHFALKLLCFLQHSGDDVNGGLVFQRSVGKVLLHINNDQ